MKPAAAPPRSIGSPPVRATTPNTLWLWLANLEFGASAAVSVADTVRGGSTIPGWFPPVQQWAGVLWQVGAPMLGLSLVLYRLVIRVGAMLPSWAGWLALAASTVVIVSLTSVRGTPPFLIYLLATLPLGVAAVFHARVLIRAVT